MIRPNQSENENKQGILKCIVYTEHITHYIIYFYSNLFEGRDIKCIQELSKPLAGMCQATELCVAYSLQNINVICFVKFRHRISEHRDTERKL